MTFGLRLIPASRAKPATSTGRHWKGDPRLTITEGQLWVNRAVESDALPRDNQESLPTATAFVYTRMSPPGLLFFLNKMPLSVGPWTQILPA